MRTILVIPARYASTRLPAKPLLRETGKYLIQHVVERAAQVRGVQRVVVATDDDRIAFAVRSFGAEAVLTSDQHVSGTDRIAEAIQPYPADLIINWQGDEPLLDPKPVEQLLETMKAQPELKMGTLAVPIQNNIDWQNPNIVKVVVDQRGRAVYFSRSPIPYCRDGQPDFSSGLYMQHVGLYIYRRSALLEFAKLPPHPLEQCEKLEQLRVLAKGWPIAVVSMPKAHPGIDTPEDYQRFVQQVSVSPRSQAA